MFKQIRIRLPQPLQRVFPHRAIAGMAAIFFFAVSACSILIGAGLSPVACVAIATEILRAHIPSSSIIRISALDVRP